MTSRSTLLAIRRHCKDMERPGRRKRRSVGLAVMARRSFWIVRHHRMGTPALHQPEPWTPER